MAGRVALVTDSTANLGVDRARAHGVEVVPLTVLVGDDQFTEGRDIDAEEIAAKLRRGPRVSTSRPSPLALLETYERLARAGATRIVSAHLSAQLSGTCEAATLAARSSPVPVEVVDSRSTGLALGYGVLAGADCAAAGGTADDVAAVIRRRCADTRVLCYVHTLDFLRRGGRIGAVSSLLGGALAVKPVLALVDGHLEPVEKLRTAGRALARVVDLAVHAARVAEGPLDIAVQHVDAERRAEAVAHEVGAALRGEVTHQVEVAALTAVVAAHLGPGTVAIVVSPASTPGGGPGLRRGMSTA